MIKSWNGRDIKIAQERSAVIGFQAQAVRSWGLNMGAQSISSILKALDALSDHERSRLVVRSMPFGDLINDETRKVHVNADNIPRGIDRIHYKLCAAAKGDSGVRKELSGLAN